MGVASLLLFLIAFAPSREKAAWEGERVLEIRVEGNRRISADQILEQLRTKVEKPLHATDVEADIRDLFARFGIRVTVRQDPQPSGVKLLLVVDEDPVIVGVEFKGVPGPRGRELLESARLADVRNVLEGQVRDGMQTIVNALHDEGRYFAEVGLTIEQRDQGPVAVLDIHEGPEVSIDSIDFVGLTSIDSDGLRAVMTTKPTRFVLLKSFLRQDQLERDIVEAERQLQAEGFRDGHVSIEKLDFNDAKDKVKIILRVQEGPRYTVSVVTFQGNKSVDDRAMFERLDLKMGDPVRSVVIDKDRKRLLELYGERGFIRAKVEPRLVYAEEGTTVEVIYKITEGEQKRVRDVMISGNEITQDSVVRREVTLEPGDVANAAELKKSVDKLRATGYFRDQRGFDLVGAKFKETGDPLLEDLIVDVEETGGAEVYFTAGASTDIGFYAGVNLVNNNFDLTDLPSSWNPVTVISEFWRGEAFHGAGQQLFVKLQPGTEVSDYRISWTDPYWSGDQKDPWSLNVQAWWNTARLEEEFREDRFGLGTTFSKKLDENWTWGVSGRVELVNIGDVHDAPNDVEDVEGTNFVPAVGVFAKYADFDRPIDPQEGFDFGARYELLLADGLGERAVLNGSMLIPVSEDERGRKQVLALKGALGAANGFSGDLPFFERFQGGGATGDFPIRGFEYRGVGPEEKDVHLGADFAWAASAEYQFPLYSSYDPLLDEDNHILRGVAFVDAGSVDTLSGLVSTPRLAVGTGVRLKLPFLGPTPVALDLALPLLKGPDDDEEYFSIRVSTRF